MSDSTSLGLLLVVDDEEFNRDMLGRRLEIEGYSVMLASGGAEALGLIAEHPFDAILLDAMMPLQSGYEVLAEIRKTRSSIDLPVLMVTAKSHSDDVVSAFEVGANDYITKPINFPVAMARINSHIASHKLSHKLKESELRYSLSAQGSNDGLWDWDLISDRIHFSERWKRIVGCESRDIGDQPSEWLGRIHPEDLPHVQKALLDHRLGRTEQFESEHRILHCDQSYRWVLARGMAVRDAAGNATRMAGSQTDITRGKAADPLTGLPNRVLFMDRLNATVQAARTGSTGHYAVLFLDLDRFKVVNDSLGHLAGDELLVVAARRLEACMHDAEVATLLGDRSTVSRFGGDEFVVLLNGLEAPEHATDVAEQILSGLAESVTLRGHEMSLSASIGIAIGHAGEDSADDLVRDADTAMYQAKSMGKSRWRIFDQSMRKQAVERLALEGDLVRGLERDEFEVKYQPIVEIPEQRIVGFESLLRWNHPVRGLVSPLEFIPIAEETGFIIDLGEWVLEQSCRQLRDWRERYPEHDGLFVSVNVSTRQFADPQLVDRVITCLERTGCEGRHLKLEITESAIMLDPETASRQLEQLQQLGIKISLDDFGTGYSSLSYLQSFNINTLKIDRSFISRLGDSEESNEIVRTIVNLAHNLGMEVVAEGIEDHKQHAQLNAMACEAGQGYLYSKPISQTSVEVLLQGGPGRSLPRDDIDQAIAATTLAPVASPVAMK